MDKDGVLKHYEGAFPYEGVYKLNESEEFQEDKVEFENSFGYMTKHLLTTLTDSEKSRQYFNMIKADKKLVVNIIYFWERNKSIGEIWCRLQGSQIIYKTKFDC